MDIDRIINAIDILVLCSQVEGHSVVTLEAMAWKKPVIGTDVRGIRSIVRQRENGTLVLIDDLIVLTKAILYLLENPSVAEAMGSSGRKDIEEQYTTDRMVSAYLKLYKEMETVWLRRS